MLDMEAAGQHDDLQTLADRFRARRLDRIGDADRGATHGEVHDRLSQMFAADPPGLRPGRWRSRRVQEPLVTQRDFVAVDGPT